jgi:hypothetical protein
MSFLAALNLGNVEAAPPNENAGVQNAPVGRGYIGRISISEYRIKEDKRFQFALFLQMQVTQGVHAGKTSMLWTVIGDEAHTAQGLNVPARHIGEMAGYKPTMTEENLKYFKRQLLDLGVENFDLFNPDTLKGLPVSWDVVERNGFMNVYSLAKAAGQSANTGLPSFPGAPAQAAAPQAPQPTAQDPWAGVISNTQPQPGNANMDPFQ